MHRALKYLTLAAVFAVVAALAEEKDEAQEIVDKAKAGTAEK